MKQFLIIFLSWIITGNTLCQTSDSIDYRIYSKIIDSFIHDCVKKYQKKSTRIILINGTSNFKNIFSEDKNYPNDIKYNCLTCYDRIDNLPVLDSGFINLILKLDTANKKTIKFSNEFILKKYKTQIIYTNEFQTFFNDANFNEGWQRFYNKYPRSIGYMTLSKVVYSNDRKRCIIYIDLKYNSLGAEGYIILFNTEDFKIIKSELLWQS
jgi:hypothetical protein